MCKTAKLIVIECVRSKGRDIYLTATGLRTHHQSLEKKKKPAYC